MIDTPSRYAHMSKSELIEALEKHDQTLQSIYQTIHLPNEKMAPGEKLFWIGARCVLTQEKPNEQGLVRLPTDKVAQFIGMSESSTGRYANTIIERYEATKESIPYTTLKGQSRTLTYVDRRDPLWQEPWTADIPEEKERTINGNGKPCPRCKTNNLQVTTRRITYQEIQECECCGYKKVSKVLGDNDPLPEGEYIPAKKGLQAGEPFGEENETGETEKAFQAGEPFSEKIENMEPLPVDTGGSILADLKALPIWCCHRAKVPYNAKPARDPQKAKSNDSSTWTTLEQAKATYEASKQWKHPYDGIGFMCTGEFTVVDYDHCIENGKIDELVLTRIQAIDSYAEVSPSGTGIHQIARGTLPRNIKQPGCEMYDHLRFVTFTGQHLAMTPETIEDRQEQLLALHTEIAPAQVEPKEVRPTGDVHTYPGACSDEEVLRKARGAANGAKFIMLFDDGKWEEVLDDKGQQKYRTQSEADEGLCAMLRYWTDWNADAMDRLFRQSKLMRPKWDRNAGAGVTYGEKTVSKALGEQIAS